MKRFLVVFLASILISTSIPAMASASSFTSLLNTAEKYIGVPYKYGGTTTSGIDCSAYTQRVFRENGITIPRDTVSQYAQGTPVSKSNLQPGDLVFFNTNGRRVSHVGVYIGSNNFIHASTSRGVMISSIYDKYYWGSRYIGARRVKDFTPTPPPVVVAKPAPPVVAKPAPVAPKPVAIPYPTRAEIADTLANELDLPTTNTTIPFNDVTTDHPKVDAILAVADAGIFTGSNGNFMPNGNLTRSQLAKVLVEAFGLEGQSAITFKDVPQDHEAYEYIAILYHNGITTGYEDGNFGVADRVTMSQFKTFIDRISK
ncbi:C40 family peptidase [Sporosarcina sp. CAU 1771]